jgi:hypothetical protein
MSSTVPDRQESPCAPVAEPEVSAQTAWLNTPGVEPAHRATSASTSAGVRCAGMGDEAGTSRARDAGSGRQRRLVLAAVSLAVGLALLMGGVGLLWLDLRKDGAGRVWGSSVPARTTGHALTSDVIHLDSSGPQRVAGSVIDEVLVEVIPRGRNDVFVGIAPADDVAAYLDGVAHQQVGSFGSGGETWAWFGDGVTTSRPGGLLPAPPGSMEFWLARSSGPGAQLTDWPLVDGDWVIVVMRTDGSADVEAELRVAAVAPDLAWFAPAVLLGGVILVVAALRLVGPRGVPVARRWSDPGDRLG